MPGVPPCAADERKGPTGTLGRASRAYTRAWLRSSVVCGFHVDHNLNRENELFQPLDGTQEVAFLPRCLMQGNGFALMMKEFEGMIVSLQAWRSVCARERES